VLLEFIEPVTQGAAALGYSKRATSENLAMPRIFRDNVEKRT